MRSREKAARHARQTKGLRYIRGGKLGYWLGIILLPALLAVTAGADGLWQDSPDIAVTTLIEWNTQSENSIFIDPTNPEIILNANNGRTGTSLVNPRISVWVSTDSGQTWTGSVEAFVPDTTFADPATAIDTYGRMYVGDTSCSKGVF